MTIQFTNVGRNHASWTAELADSTEAAIIREVRKRKVLASKEIFAEDGTIYAGFRPVGQYRVIQPSASFSA